jgi:cholesterol oxidase
MIAGQAHNGAAVPRLSRLATPVDRMRAHYDVVVVGSGYGGSIAASRLARAGRSVCLLERGRELQPGEYPDNAAEAVREFQVDHPRGHVGPDTGLFDFRVNDEMNVFVGCGLGGTSLVNANVSLPAEDRVFDDDVWPEALRGEGALTEGYARAVAMLRPRGYPAELPPLAKLTALEQAATGTGGSFYRPPINVTFEDGENHVGVHQQACRLCGDCVSGCNYRAKNTTLMNYLPDAVNHGAEIYTRTRVSHVERRGGHWLVHYALLDVGRERFADAPLPFVSAEVVVLGAGSLGSTEILLRSEKRGLPLSEHLGTRFTGNGDVLAFAYNLDQPVNGIGFGDRNVGELAPVGPCIAGIIDLRQQDNLEHGMVIEEGVIPGAVSVSLPFMFPFFAHHLGRDADGGMRDFYEERRRELESLLEGAREGALANTLTFLVMTHDDSGGEIVLGDGERARVVWKNVGAQPIFQRVHETLQKAAAAVHGTYLKNPIWSQAFGQDLVTVHPLGGCPMADTAEHGVVDDRGRVFSGASGEEVHDGLYVLDGSIVPRSLGVNPLLTISALAERSCELLAGPIPTGLPYAEGRTPAPAPQPAPAIGVRFTERMTGAFSTRLTDDFEAAAAAGKDDDSRLTFVLTVIASDLALLLKDPTHRGRLVGTVEAPALSPGPLTVRNGDFGLFVDVPDDPEDGKRMTYRMELAAEDGSSFHFDGFKRIHDDPGLDQWADTTTLFVTVRREGEDGPVAGRGILRIRQQDFMRQMTTMQVTGAAGPREELAAMGRFGSYFTGSLRDVYGLF